MVLERMPLETQKELFKRVEDYMDVSNLKEEDMEKYEAIERAVDSYNLGMYGSWVRGTRKGREEGKLEANIKTARNLLKMGLSIDQIVQATGLSKERVTKMSK